MSKLPESTVPAKADSAIAAALDSAREAATKAAADFGVGDYLGCIAEDELVGTHFFACTHPGYPGWKWAVTMTRVPRARTTTVDEVVLLPGDDALLAPTWVPWSERVQPGDITPGMLLPTPDNDPRLEPGYTGGEMAPDEDPAEWAQTRALVAELGLGRERVLSVAGRNETAERWMLGAPGANNAATKLAPANCVTCGFFVRLGGRLGALFGACTNEFSPFDARVVALDHGCGGHSDVVSDERVPEASAPVYDTIGIDHPIFG
ncbi:MAG: DUF3027 domain-containing protein [Propionibacteriaceae bacterium]|nr:DUF3027 domain-containing protein [Propionibacteriaceae bacterium]